VFKDLDNTLEKVSHLTVKNILLEKRDGVAEITINRPPLNILDIETLRELNEALRSIKKDDSVSIVTLRGAGERAFSAGVDIRDHMPEKVEELLEAFHEIFFSLEDLDRLTIAVVDGFALGGGCEVAAACDMVIASERSKFGQPEINAGVLPPPATVLFPELIGRRKTFELILTGDSVDAKEAERIGLVNKVIPAEKLDKTVDELVGKLKEKSPVVLRLTRRAIYRAFNLDLRSALANVTDIYLSSLMNTEDAVEGLRAFLEKRKPVWKGK
jgi:cyclohexa-1,5-dienecarbonyl-CoA hydratase